MVRSRHYLILLFLSLIKTAASLELSFPNFTTNDDRLQLTRVSIILGSVYGLSLFLQLIFPCLPLKLLIIMAAIILNLITYYAFHNHHFFCFSTKSNQHLVAPAAYMIYYLPVHIASVCFQCDKSQFQKVLPYAFVTSVLIICTGILNGYILFMLTPLNWSYFRMYIFGVSTCSSQPDPLSYSLKNKSFIKLNRLSKGEYIGTMLLCMTIVEMYIDGKIGGWNSLLVFVTVETVLAMAMGLIVGCIFACTLGLTNDDAKSCFLIIMCSMVCVYYAAICIGASPYVAVFSMVLPLYRYKDFFSQDANEAIQEFFNMSHLLIDLLMYAYCVHLAIFILMHEKNFNNVRISYSIFGFCCMFFSRSLIYLCLSPVIKRMSMSLDTVVIVVNAWATITSNVAFVISFMFYFQEKTKEFGVIILCQVCFSAVCTNIINPVALEFLRRNKFSSNFTTDQAANIHTCLHEIRSLRVKYIYMWKMKGIMTDARWDMIKNFTNIFHTSKRDSIGDLMLKKNVTCPDCGREIQVQQPIKDVSDFAKLSRKLIKNQMKTILTRRHQFGVISTAAMKKCMKTVERCLTFDKHIQHELFQPYMNLGCVKGKIYQWEQHIFSKYEFLKRVPRKPTRALYYKFVRSTSFTYVVFSLTIYSVTMLILSMFITSLHSVYFYTVMSLSKVYIFVMISQMYIFIYIYSVFSCRQGAKCYFKSTWHCIESFSLLFSLIDLVLILVLYALNDIDTWHTYKYVRLIQLVEVLSAFKTSMPKIIYSMEDSLVGRISLGYEVSKAIYDAYSELELSMDFIFDDNVRMASECEKWVREDKHQLFEIFTHFQYNYPNITRSVKTKQAMNATMTVLGLTLKEIRASGYVDAKEYNTMKMQLRSCEKRGKQLEKTWQQISPKDIFRNVFWVSLTQIEMQDYLLSVCTLKTLETGEVLCSTGDHLDGVYIILSGMLKLDYNPSPEIINNLLKHGLIPVFKYCESLQFFDQVEHILVVGNSVGEMAIATNRQIDITVTACKPTKLYYVNKESIHTAEVFRRDPINGLIAQMWKMTCFNISTAILKSLPKYEFYTQHDIKLKVEGSFVPDLSNYKVFTFLDAIDDLILLHGIIKDYHSSMYYVAPCYIPRSVIKFYMHQTNISYELAPMEFVESKLMIIPMQDIDKYAVMKLENQVAELYSTKIKDIQFAADEGEIKLQETGMQLAGLAAMKSVTQGSHLTKFINLKK